MNKKIIQYREFYLAVCYTEKFEPVWVGTIYNKKFDKYIWWTNHHYYNKVLYEYREEFLITKMKEEVDKFLEKFIKYLEYQIEDTKLKLNSLLLDLN
jgi:hypothetical protein